MTFINVEKECDRLDEMYSLGDMGRRERDDIAIFMQEIATPVDAIPVEWIEETMKLAETVGAKEYAEHLEVLLADWAEEREDDETN